MTAFNALDLPRGSCSNIPPHPLRGRRHFDVAHSQVGEGVDDSVDHGSQRGCRTPSPPERTPSLFVGAGTSLNAVARNGTVSVRGIA